MVGAALTHAESPVTVHACVAYWINGERSNGTRGDNAWAGVLTFETPVDESWNLLWEFKGIFSESDREYRRTYVAPGIQWNGERVSVGFSGLVSASGVGGGGAARYDFDWAPYIRVYYRMF
jgi:hypothetical protein